MKICSTNSVLKMFPFFHVDVGSDDKNDDEEERRKVGRPNTGAVNLNIKRTGRGQGRPKKAVAAKRAANGDSDISKKRGRPAASNKESYKPTGKPRGRPSANNSGAANSQDENDISGDDNINKSKTSDDLRSYIVSDDEKDNDNDKDNDIDNDNDNDDDNDGNDNDDNENENEV